MRYRRVRLHKVEEIPQHPEKYRIIKNQYWALDIFFKERYVFFTGGYPICAYTKQSVGFYIRRMELPLRPSYQGNNAPNWPMVYLTLAWVKK